MRLIDAEKIRYSWQTEKDGTWHDGITLQSIIDLLPTVDAVEVVRCRDCTHRHESEFCECRPEDFYCADGERKEINITLNVDGPQLKKSVLEILESYHKRIDARRGTW